MTASEREAIRSFEDLIVWQKSVDVADAVLELADSEPLSRRFWLCNQLGAAAASIAANIAEGHDGGSRRVYLKHLYIARGSSAEVLTFLRIVGRRKYADPARPDAIRGLLVEVRKMLNALINRLSQEPAEPDNAGET